MPIFLLWCTLPFKLRRAGKSISHLAPVGDFAIGSRRFAVHVVFLILIIAADADFIGPAGSPCIYMRQSQAPGLDRLDGLVFTSLCLPHATCRIRFNEYM
jgi:hypothetical protein